MGFHELVEVIVFSIIYGVLTITYFIAAWISARHYIHMFQLNSYKPKVQLKWIWTNSKKYLIAYTVLSAWCVLLWLSGGAMHFASEMIIAFIATAVIMKPNKKVHKTPLVFTARIKRLLITLAVLHFVPFLLLIDAKELFIGLPTAFSLVLLLEPFMILLANLINRPLELAINRHYINDAKRIISDCKNLTVIGITGSFGKTSVKYFLDTLLSVKYNVLKTPGNFNTTLGVVKTIRGSLRATHDVFLCEMGAKNCGDIKEICDIVHPKHGIITSVGPMHLESFKTIQNVKKTKFELADSLPESGMLFLNMDDENIRDHATDMQYERIAYGIDSDAEYKVSNLHISEKGSEFWVTSPEGRVCEYRTKLIGRHNVLNIAGAIAVANKMGITLDELKPAVRKLESVPHRLELINKGAYTVIDDAYNSNPSGTKAALEALSMTDGYKILVTPGMIELGEMEDELNREFGKNAARVCDFVALVGKNQTKAIFEGLVSQGFDVSRIYVAESLNDAMNCVYGLTTDGKRKIILLENDLPDNY